MARAKGFKAPNRTQRLRVNLQNAINEAKTYSDMNEQEFCNALHMCRSTLWSYLKEPERFNLSHLRMIAMLSGQDFSEFLAELVK